MWTVSAGNAAQGVALAARTAGVPCSVMVMDTAPAIKVRAIEQLGATIVRATYDECWRTVEQHGSDRMRGLFVHPFDDDRFIAGNGTVGLEILEDLPDVDAVVGRARRRRTAGGRRVRDPRQATRGAGLRRRAGDSGAVRHVAEKRPRERVRGLAGIVRRRRRRPIGAADDVAAAVAAAGRFDRRAAGRGQQRP